MAKKRKSVASRLDEVDRNMYTTFCSAANSLSQLYSNAISQQRLSFHAGERHALEKLYQWIAQHQEEGARVNTTDIVAYLRNEMDYGSEDHSVSTRLPPNNNQPTHIAAPVASGMFGSMSAGQVARSSFVEHQTKNSVFSNALSSPVRRNLQMTQGAFGSNNVVPSGNEPRGNENTITNLQNRESNSHSSNESMDMHSESPGHESSF